MKDPKKTEKKKELFPRKPIYIWVIGVGLILTLAFVAICTLQSVKHMEEVTQTTMTAAEGQIEYRVAQSINLLNALAKEERYYNPDLPYIDKVLSLESINEEFGYMMIRYVDGDINVCSQRGTTSLASRDYMQKLFATGETQVTDSFVAGADGATLNYTVAVPLYQNGEIVGALFCAIYFDEIQDLLTSAVREEGLEVIVLGSQNQIMSATDTLHYGDSYIDYISDLTIMGSNKNELETDFFGKDAGSYWTRGNGDMFYTSYANIENTGWTVLATADLRTIYMGQFSPVFFGIVISIVLLLVSLLFFNGYLNRQQKEVDGIVKTVHNLEQQVYVNDTTQEPDFQKIMKLTEDGLVDDLTGLVTKIVFENKLPDYLTMVHPTTTAAVCYVDVDDLSLINETYGYTVGDRLLKNIGYVLREYEKKYDGLSCREQGDRFLLLLTGLRDVEDLRQVVTGLSVRLVTGLGEENSNVKVGATLGVAVYKQDTSATDLIEEAHRMAKKSKEKGKGLFEISTDGE